VRRRRLPRLALAAAVTIAGLPSRPGVAAPESPPSIELRVSKRGFEPSRITLRRGETARLVLSSADGEHCFAIDAFRIEKRVVPGRPTRLDLTPDRAGVFPFYCCLESGGAAEVERGQLTVAE
jgi:heme/copper-type cytochrome/quinol oxidase subunit 2